MWWECKKNVKKQHSVLHPNVSNTHKSDSVYQVQDISGDPQMLKFWGTREVKRPQNTHGGRGVRSWQTCDQVLLRKPFITFAKQPDLSSTLRVKGPNPSPSTSEGTDIALRQDAGYREKAKAHDPKNQPENICGLSLHIGRETAAISISIKINVPLDYTHVKIPTQNLDTVTYLEGKWGRKAS